MKSPIVSLRRFRAILVLALGVVCALAAPAARALAADLVPSIEVQTYVRGMGWRAPDASGATSGGDGSGQAVAGLRLALRGATGTGNDLAYAVFQDGAWGGYVPSGEVAGNLQSPVEGVRIRLGNAAASAYTLAYRSSVAGGGWLGWAHDDEISGGPGLVTLDAIQVRLLPTGATPTTDGGSPTVTTPGLRFSGYVDGEGWSGPVGSGNGVGKGNVSLLGLRAAITGDANRVPGTLRYRVYAGNGWQGWVSDERDACAVDPAAPIQAVELSLDGALASHFDLWYRTYVHDVGWLGYAKGGATAGAAGYGLPVEAVQIFLLPKGQAPEGDGGSPTVTVPGIAFSAYEEGKGWIGPVSSGNGVGEGGIPLQDFTASLTGGPSRVPGSIRYRVYTDAGWRDWAADGQQARPNASDGPIQAIQIRLEGAAANGFDVWYHVYLPGYGWLGYTGNGESAGATGLGIAAEAVQIHLVPKGSAAPGSTDLPFVDESSVSKLGWQNPAGYYQVSSKSVLPRPGSYYPFNYVTPSRISVWATRDDCVNAFVQRAREYLGTPYVWDYACAPGVGVDCIGLVYQCAYATGMDLGEFNPWDHWATGANGWHSHDAVNMWDYGNIQRLPVSQREYGDLIFFPGHVGIYVGGDRMIHAYPGLGVTESSMWGWGSVLGVGRLYVR